MYVGKVNLLIGSVALLPATSRVLDRIAAYERVARDAADASTARDRLRVAQAVGFDGSLVEHRRAWASRWEDADVRIDGAPQLQLAVRLAIFHLIASASDRGEAAIGARGLAGSAYRGHVFWDTDVYVMPMLPALTRERRPKHPPQPSWGDRPLVHVRPDVTSIHIIPSCPGRRRSGLSLTRSIHAM